MVPRIYFVQSGHRGPIKIGRCIGNLEARIAELQIGNPMDLLLVGAMLGGPPDEIELHRRFNDLRIRGEWFHPGSALLRFIASCR